MLPGNLDEFMWRECIGENRFIRNTWGVGCRIAYMIRSIHGNLVESCFVDEIDCEYTFAQLSFRHFRHLI